MEIRPFVIDSEQLICLLFEEIWGQDTYTLNSLEDAHFRVPDFGPDIIFVSADLYFSSIEKVEELISTQIPVVIIGFQEDLRKLSSLWSGPTLEKPLEAEKLKESVGELLAQIKRL
jgi:two-component SAPR family response regulator